MHTALQHCAKIDGRRASDCNPSARRRSESCSIPLFYTTSTVSPGYLPPSSIPTCLSLVASILRARDCDVTPSPPPPRVSLLVAFARRAAAARASSAAIASAASEISRVRRARRRERGDAQRRTRSQRHPEPRVRVHVDAFRPTVSHEEVFGPRLRGLKFAREFGVSS